MSETETPAGSLPVDPTSTTTTGGETGTKPQASAEIPQAVQTASVTDPVVLQLIKPVIDDALMPVTTVLRLLALESQL